MEDSANESLLSCDFEINPPQGEGENGGKMTHTCQSPAEILGRSNWKEALRVIKAYVATEEGSGVFFGEDATGHPNTIAGPWLLVGTCSGSPEHWRKVILPRISFVLPTNIRSAIQDFLEDAERETTPGDF